MRTLITAILFLCSTSLYSQTKYGIEWIPWSAQKVSELRAEGRPTFVFYTAEWDLTSQLNLKRAFTSSGSKKLKTKIKEHNIAIVEADCTKPDKEIEADLARLNQKLIPLTIFYPADSTEQTVILPELLSANDMLAVLGEDSSALPILSWERWLGVFLVLAILIIVALFNWARSRKAGESEFSDN